MSIIYEENTLTAKQFFMLRESVGFRSICEPQIDKALKNGLYNISAKDGNKVIGMGRLVGDGFMYWYVQDVIVDPRHQGKGIGKEIVIRLTQYIEKNSLPDTTVTIGLMAAKGKDGFYENLGYIARPTDKFGAGMIKFHKIPAN
jgi:GNAT superfamily N-acetyltransferase